MLSKSTVESFCEKVLKLSDADMTTVTIGGEREALTRFSSNEITQNVDSSIYTFTIRSVYGDKVGSATGTSLATKDIKKFVIAAKEIALNQKKGKKILPLPQKQNYKTFKGFDQKTEDVTPDARAKMVKTGVRICEKNRMMSAGICSNNATVRAIANSKGVFAYHTGTNATFSITAMTKDSSGWAEQSEQSVEKISAEKATKTAVEKAEMSKNPKTAEPGYYTVVLEPSAAADLISFLSYSVINGLKYAEGRSFLSGKMGKQVANSNITIVDDPYMEGIGGIPFDFEGFPRKTVSIIEKGVFKSMVTDRKVAKMIKMENTGHSLGADDEYGPIPFNLHLLPGKNSVEEMIKTTNKGILVTQFHYVNILDPMQTTVTGMTRNGIFLIENGKVKNGLKNLRFTQSIMEALNNVEMVGKESIIQNGGFGGGFCVPAMKLKKFHFTSVTGF